MSAPVQQVDLLGMPIAALRSSELLDRIEAACERAEGGWVVTVNLDILQHFCSTQGADEAYLAADLRVADGMPLLWAARAQGDALPERVAGSTFSSALVERAAKHGWPVALLGGSPGSAERAADKLRSSLPGLRISARSDLRFAQPPSPAEVALARDALPAETRIVLVGLGSPKQELLIKAIKQSFPQAWFIGVGGTFGFLAGDQPRAPVLLQRAGLEWAYRLALEPRRLSHRYLVRNLPFLARVLALSVLRRWRSGGGPP
jgi:N-acetylglucosaminyldiphosphoundecaprenol N-acetyl-beta-D-mannosaminyltransferase